MTFTIDLENNITVLASSQHIEERQNGTETFSTPQVPTRVNSPRIEQFRPLQRAANGKLSYGLQEIRADRTLMTGSRFPNPGYRFNSRSVDLTRRSSWRSMPTSSARRASCSSPPSSRGCSPTSFGPASSGSRPTTSKSWTAAASPSRSSLRSGRSVRPTRIAIGRSTTSSSGIRVGKTGAIIEKFKDELPGRFGGIAELVLKLDQRFDAVGLAFAGPVHHLRKDRVQPHR